MKNFKISFCVVCMNRLHHLITTLQQNIDDNKDYPNLEFIVLDYNSQDGMEKWMQVNMMHYIQSGLIKYYRTPDPEFFMHSHSKNMAFRLATGDIVCNINADHFIGKGFADYVNELFNREPQIVITCDDYFKTRPDYKAPATDVMGKVCVKRADFNQVTGFDEKIVNYGFEDTDFINRLELSGLKRSFIERPSFFKFISHDNEERFSVNQLLSNIYAIYFHYRTPIETEIIVLYTDHTYRSGILVDNFAINSNDPKYAYSKRITRYKLSMKEGKYIQGTWIDNNSYLAFSDEQLIKSKINGCDTLFLESEHKTFYCITDPMIIEHIAHFMHLYPGRAIMEHNLKNKRIAVNNKFGSGSVYKNFNAEKPIYL